MQARVPGHVHDDLVRHGVIEDPFYRMNERDCQWVDQEDWVYRCRFSWAPAVGMPRKVLRFEGLDTVCTVILNGEKIAESDNMFLPFEVDVASVLRVGDNELVIEFQSAVRVAESRRSAYMAKEGIDPSVFTFYDRSFVRKAQYMFGWDWGPRLVSCGIWKPVVLMEYDTRTSDVWIRPRKAEGGKWEVNVSWEGERSDARVQVRSHDGFAVVKESEHFALLLIEDPKLWQPNLATLARQTEFYFLNLLVDGADDLHQFGLRTVELLREPDEWGESFEFLVNDTPVFCKGANWIPDHSFPGLISDETYADQAMAMRDLNFNMVRVWGGGLYESNRFYDACDQDGIMIWQDFPFACAYYPEDAKTLASIEKEARANIRRLRNHPSLVLWCGNNENQQMHEQKWGGEKSPELFYGEMIYDELLPRILKEEDPDRPYVHGSPSGKVEGRDSNMDGVGDSHYWDVWHGRGDWKHYEDSKSRFCSEFGFASSPSLYTWSKTIGKDDWQFDSEAVKWHDKTLKGYEKYISYIELHYPKIETLEDLVYYSQLNQRDAMRHGIEHFLMSESCAGTLIWQFNDCWPVQSWAVQDSEGQSKPAARELSRLYGRKCFCVKADDARMVVYSIQKSQCELDGRAPQFVVYDLLTGESILEEDLSQAVSLEIGCIEVFRFDYSYLDSSRHAAFMSSGGGKWKSSFHARLFCEPKDLKAVPAPIVISIEDPEWWQLRSDLPAIDLMIWDPDDPSSSLPSFEPFLLPNKREKLSARFTHEPKRLVARSLAGYHEVEITRSPL